MAPRDVATRLHVHPEDDESFYVLEGELTFFLEDGQPIPTPAGSFAHSPAGTAHAFRVDSETARFLHLTTPQHESFMRAAGEAAQGRILPPEGPPDMEKLGAAAQQYGVGILGPPPGGPSIPEGYTRSTWACSLHPLPVPARLPLARYARRERQLEVDLVPG